MRVCTSGCNKAALFGLVCVHPVNRVRAAHLLQTHLSEEVDISETLSQQQDVRVPALLGAPAQVLSNGQRQIPRVVAEPQQVRLVHPHLGQTCWGRGQRVGWAVIQKESGRIIQNNNKAKV